MDHQQEEKPEQRPLTPNEIELNELEKFKLTDVLQPAQYCVMCGARHCWCGFSRSLHRSEL